MSQTYTNLYSRVAKGQLTSEEAAVLLDYDRLLKDRRLAIINLFLSVIGLALTFGIFAYLVTVGTR
jgi:hypothetical protein